MTNQHPKKSGITPNVLETTYH